MILDYVVAILLWLSLIAYGVLGGADFGAGIWDLLAFGKREEDQHELIKQAIGPVWEANNVWLTYLIVGLFAAFPIVAQVLSTALFIPFILILIGIVLRGASFAFRSQIKSAPAPQKIWRQAFALASLITPFLFGAGATAVASGSLAFVHGQIPVSLVGAWLTPFAIVIGLMALAICATLAGIFLTVEAQAQEKQEMMEIFRWRALIAGACMSVLGAVGLALAPSEAPILWHGLLSHGLWAVAITFVLGLATAGTLFFRRYRLARVLIVLSVAAILGTWGVSQLPYIVPPDLTITDAASPPLTMAEFLGSALVGMSLLIPSLWFLFFVFKGENIIPRIHGKEVEDI